MNLAALRASQNPADRLVLALDVPDRRRALELAGRLAGRAGWLKVGLELFAAEGLSLLDELKTAAPSAGLFLDLKLHDIPATVGRALAALLSSTAGGPAGARPTIELVTVHAQGGPEMMAAAAAAAGETIVLGVTVLTSLAPERLDELTEECRRPGRYVVKLAQRALAAGCRGLVASPLEAADLRDRFGPDFLLVTPGIRPGGRRTAGDDQKRAADVGDALAAGADLLVVGRPLRDAPDPAEAADRLLAEIARHL
ncbi:MAG: orotidine-5'-phosphate decarboxylase [Deltaproteobacteria bacterium]|jgi:orotidine-5'-phosphate decarboxylase|nr:orotidine-5'-phosphate decarboxylase [Deltaproteobacteria bacterium]